MYNEAVGRLAGVAHGDDCHLVGREGAVVLSTSAFRRTGPGLRHVAIQRGRGLNRADLKLALTALTGLGRIWLYIYIWTGFFQHAHMCNP